MGQEQRGAAPEDLLPAANQRLGRSTCSHVRRDHPLLPHVSAQQTLEGEIYCTLKTVGGAIFYFYLITKYQKCQIHVQNILTMPQFGFSASTQPAGLFTNRLSRSALELSKALSSPDLTLKRQLISSCALYFYLCLFMSCSASFCPIHHIHFSPPPHRRSGSIS